MIFQKGNGGSNNSMPQLRNERGKLKYAWRSSPNGNVAHSQTSNVVLPPNAWTHIMAVHGSGSQPILYINGVEQAVVPGGNQSIPRGLNNDWISVGVDKRPTGNNKHHDGKLDDIRIYNRALSAEEVKALYEFEKPKEKGEK